MLIKHIVITICLFTITAIPAAAQQNSSDLDESDYKPTTLTITEDMFECFQSLQCLKEENPFKYSNLDEIRLNNMTKKYVVEGSSKNESLYAVYNGNGDLIKATVIQRNIPLPNSIVRTLLSGEFESWRIIGNELVVENFDKESRQYKVILQNDTEVRVEFFNHNGQQISRIS